MRVGLKIFGVSEWPRVGLWEGIGKFPLNFLDSFAYFSDQAEK